MRALAALLLVLLAPASRAEGTGAVRGRVSIQEERDGARVPVADASNVVIYLTGFAQPPPATVAQMKQEGRSFSPEVLPIVKGQEVSFPNRDPILHNVFSRSRAAGSQGKEAAAGRAGFDLGKYRDTDAPKRVRFDQATGVVDVYCDIHESMAASILVLPNRAFAVTGADGRFRLAGVPPGRWTAFAWSRRTAPQRLEVEVRPGGEAVLDFTLVQGEAPAKHQDKHGRPYRARGSYD